MTSQERDALKNELKLVRQEMGGISPKLSTYKMLAKRAAELEARLK